MSPAGLRPEVNLALGCLKLVEGRNVGIDNIAQIALVRSGVSQQSCVQRLHNTSHVQ